MLASARHAQISFRRLFMAGSCCSGEQRPADGSDARVNRAASNHPLRSCFVSDGEITSRKHGNEYTTAN
jgi:hypothetical protein